MKRPKIRPLYTISPLVAGVNHRAPFTQPFKQNAAEYERSAEVIRKIFEEIAPREE